MKNLKHAALTCAILVAGSFSAHAQQSGGTPQAVDSASKAAVSPFVVSSKTTSDAFSASGEPVQRHFKRGGRQPIDPAKGLYNTMIPGVKTANGTYLACPQRYFAVGSADALECKPAGAGRPGAEAPKGLEPVQPRSFADAAALVNSFIEVEDDYKLSILGPMPEEPARGMNWLKIKFQVLKK
ncbi:hypothetical protein [Comamonas thiooxydans]|uniref:hypothetical protein n=1 Tax=Comamonas thiooxydans TaxID=363952 RepID=UPI000B40F29D|nr:hypothetical protein [Comamonas thiooxydans]